MRVETMEGTGQNCLIPLTKIIIASAPARTPAIPWVYAIATLHLFA